MRALVHLENVKRLLIVVVVGVSTAALAGDADDALQALREAQKAGEACKPIQTKLKLAIEATEHAGKAPSPGTAKQAAGRVEAVKTAAASCSDAAKITAPLDTALAALAKLENPAKAPHTGAAFEAACKTNDECASEHCFVDAKGAGYCSKECSAASDCPAKWECRRPGSEAFKICIR